MITCQGKSVFSGVAIGKIFVYKKADNTVEKYQIEDAAAEFERFKAAQDAFFRYEEASDKKLAELEKGLYKTECELVGNMWLE